MTLLYLKAENSDDTGIEIITDTISQNIPVIELDW